MKKREIKKTQFTIRLEPPIFDFLKAEAKKQNRSLNNYIEIFLKEKKNNIESYFDAKCYCETAVSGDWPCKVCMEKLK